LGQGAFGTTYLVTDTIQDQPFALKEYLPRRLAMRHADQRLGPAGDPLGEAFEKGKQQFLSEGRALSQLDHPHVVSVLRCFEANGTAYMLMPWYQGEALHRLLQRSGTLTRDEAMALSRPLLRALEYLHGRGVIHQDIKPANIYIRRNGEPLLLDFGAAGLATQDKDQQQLGSEGYAALEQSDPAGKIGPWTDIYGLAATLYRCISGRVPVAADQRQQALKAGQPDPLKSLTGVIDAREFAPLPEAVSQGMGVDIAARPGSVGEWEKVFSTGRPGSSPGAAPGPDPEGREWLPLTLLGILAVTLLAGVFYLLSDGTPSLTDPEAALTADTPESRAPDPRRPVDTEERQRWQSALEADTAYAYRRFMQDYPNSIHMDQAMVHLERLDHQAWGQAQAAGSRAAIEAYLAEFPEALHAVDADIALNEIALAEEAEQRRQEALQREDSAAWEATRKAGSLEAIDAYLSAWPAGLHAEAARELKRQVQAEQNDQRAFEAARKLGTIEAYETYLEGFPGGVNVAAALEAIDDLTLRPGKTFRDCPDCPTMMVVPAGSFWQGSDETDPLALKKETPSRLVTIGEPFAISVFEITMAQWDSCVAEGGCQARPGDNGWGRGNRPVIMVSWNDAQEYTNWLSQRTGQAYSLPSESQWEYAARAGESSDWLGGDPARICRYANVAGAESGLRWQHEACPDPAALETLPVGSLEPNAFGLYDVIGNVAEWTQDCMNLSYLDAPIDGSAWGRGICSSRMTRGGSWFTGTRDIRLPARFSLKNGDRNDFTGFRVVRKVEDQ
jgi:formylglycine-generating enzyme required for sulfatase activity/serine/threonine protein kinase